MAMQELAQPFAGLQIHRDVPLAVLRERMRRQHQLAFNRRRSHQTHA
ncbi:hypothetical protein LL972_20020 [Xanthomonas campestris pv. asclepiadis]|nr:hypothetical protein [Xanthomonas campestris]MCC4618249.1 hypothetical protein [Xanthomonas campestris pv. asclepiadis]